MFVAVYVLDKVSLAQVKEPVFTVIPAFAVIKPEAVIEMNQVKVDKVPDVLKKVDSPNIEDYKVSHPDFDIFTSLPEW